MTRLQSLSRNFLTIKVILVFLTFTSCATQQAPQGGDVDKTPPKIDSSSYSTPNGSVNFKYNNIILTFNENIKLNDAFNQVLISPFMATKPDVKVKNKSVVLTFKEPLRPNMTYTINYGKSIQDITASNTAADLQYKISTGPKLDSAIVRGRTIEAVTGEPMKDLVVMLYDNPADSSFQKQTPLYIAKSDETGNFTLPNLKAGAYRLYALSDINSNFKYDLPNEKIAFIDSLITINDSLSKVFTLKVFEKSQALRAISSESRQFGSVNITFNQTLETLPKFKVLDAAPEDFIKLVEFEKDQVTLWYNTDLDSIRLLAANKDTLKLTLRKQATYLANNPVLGFKAANKTATKRAKGKEKAEKLGLPQTILTREQSTLSFSHPLVACDSTLVQIYEDTIKKVFKTPHTQLDSMGRLQVKFAWKAKTKYRIVLLPKALKDIFEVSNADTLTQIVSVIAPDDLGNGQVKLVGADKTKNYIVQWLDNDKKILKTDFPASDTTITLNYSAQKPNTYYARIIADNNKNGVWDTGDFEDKRQPEPVFLSDPIKIISKFDTEMEVPLQPNGKRKGKSKGKF